MLYYQVKPEFDQKNRCDGSILVANELYTQREKERFAISDEAVDAVQVSKRSVYFFFGVRFGGLK